MTVIGPELMLAFTVAMPFLFVGALSRELAIETNNSRHAWEMFAAALDTVVLNFGWRYWTVRSYAAK